MHSNSHNILLTFDQRQLINDENFPKITTDSMIQILLHNDNITILKCRKKQKLYKLIPAPYHLSPRNLQKKHPQFYSNLHYVLLTTLTASNCSTMSVGMLFHFQKVFCCLIKTKKSVMFLIIVADGISSSSFSDSSCNHSLHKQG